MGHTHTLYNVVLCIMASRKDRERERETYSSNDGLLLFLQVLGELCPRSVVPYEVWILHVTIESLQQL